MGLRKFLPLILIALFIPAGTSAPGGIGKSADEGCLCHGEKNPSTQIEVLGLPEAFESNTTYNFSIEVKSEAVPVVEGGEKGGFRLRVSEGQIGYNVSENLIQPMDDGWTHTESGNAIRMWNFSFTSPADNSSFVDFSIYGNAVNGNQASTGDQWNSVTIRLPGMSYHGEVFSQDVEKFSPTDYSVGLISLLALILLLAAAVRN